MDLNNLITLTAKAKFNMELYNFMSHLDNDFNYTLYKNYLNKYKELHNNLLNNTSGDPTKDMLLMYDQIESEWLKNHPEHSDKYLEFKNSEGIKEDEIEESILVRIKNNLTELIKKMEE